MKLSNKVKISILLLVVSIVSTLFVWLQYAIDPTLKTHPELFAIFFLMTTILITDRVAAIVSEKFADDDTGKLHQVISDLSGEMHKKITALPSLFAGRNDVITFPTSSEGLKHCICAVPMAKFVRNTVFRYSEPHTGMSGDLYEKWISAKRASLENECTWVEIVSQYILPDDPQSHFMKWAQAPGKGYTSILCDDKRQAVLQMTIFEFGNGSKEILFGWKFPDMPHGPCFMTRNEKLVEYFEKYFAYIEKLAISSITATT